MRAAVLLAVTASLIPSAGVGQWLSSPSSHFGASTIPSDGVQSYVGVTVDRFTPTGKITEPGTYNAIDQTIGFNFLVYSVASRSTRWDGLIHRVTFQLGWGHDQPTSWIQHGLHHLANLPPVLSTNPRNHVLDAALAFEGVRWSAQAGRWPRFFGGGLAVGTPHSEVWVNAGLKGRFDDDWPEVSVMARVGSPFLGGAFPDSTLVPLYAAVEARADVPVGRWIGVRWFPTPFVAVRQDSGFFLNVSGRRIPELHGSIGFSGRDESWRFEAWNEYFGGTPKDIGPTGGGRLTFRVKSWGLLDWLP